MPTLTELKAAYPDMSESELQSRWAARHPGEPLQGEAPPAAAPTMMERLKSVATNPTVLKTAGGMAGLAFAPEATIPAMLMAGAGSALGGTTSHMLRGEKESPEQVAFDAAEGAAGPAIGPALGFAGKALGYVGESIPRSVRAMIGLGGLATGHPGAIAAEAAINPKLLPVLLTKMGRGADAVVSKIRGAALGSGEAAATEAPDAAAEAVLGRARASSNAATGQSREIPYRMGSGVGGEPPSLAGLRETMAPAASHEAAPVAEMAGNGASAVSRPPADFIHPPDTSGTKFGFPNLPSISEGELARLQQLFKRTTGR